MPSGCGIRVGEEERAWKEGECMFFDDSYGEPPVGWRVGGVVCAVKASACVELHRPTYAHVPVSFP